VIDLTGLRVLPYLLWPSMDRAYADQDSCDGAAACACRPVSRMILKRSCVPSEITVVPVVREDLCFGFRIVSRSGGPAVRK
jgi:hypothetical protein